MPWAWRGALALFVPAQLVILWVAWDLDPGIVAFELAGTARASAAILEAWGEEGVRLGLLVHAADLPYLAGYGWGLFLIVRALGGGPVAWLPVAAAACDVVENAALVLILLTGPTDVLAGGAAAFAGVKFGLLGLTPLLLLLRRRTR